MENEHHSLDQTEDMESEQTSRSPLLSPSARGATDNNNLITEGGENCCTSKETDSNGIEAADDDEKADDDRLSNANSIDELSVRRKLEVPYYLQGIKERLDDHLNNSSTNDGGLQRRRTSTGDSLDLQENKQEDFDNRHQFDLENEGNHPNIDNQKSITSVNSILENLRKTHNVLESVSEDPNKILNLDSSGETNNQTDSDGLSPLQKAYLNLQHQQMLQVQLIQKIQAQLSLHNTIIPKDSPVEQETSDIKNQGNSQNIDNKSLPDELNNSIIANERAITQDTEESQQALEQEKKEKHPSFRSTFSSKCGTEDSVIIPNESPADAGINSLEKLQQTANHVLNKASQGIFTNHLIDGNNGEPRDGTVRHKCRYCGKVFGSDSGLQIHLRSHTGERPFKCNICGNRFTTRGNLKVHFQRHQSRFPHVKMNHNPVPEHLDKLYVPLLAQLGELEETPPAPTGPPNAFPTLATPPQPQFLNIRSEGSHSIQRPFESLPGYDARDPKFPQSIFPNFSHKMNLNLTKLPASSSDDGFSDQADESSKLQEGMSRNESDKIDTAVESDDVNVDDIESNSDLKDDEDDIDSQSDHSDGNRQETPNPMNIFALLQQRSKEIFPPMIPGLRLPFGLPVFPGLELPFNNQAPEASKPLLGPNHDVTKDPNIYTNLLPRPGSTDNAWEALIEVQKTSETMKLEQLVNNIENKLTDPNQCAICHRVLSCKSALQMHYRIHTGERPYKCKICTRTFTTKGNLKTHMSVHRAKPPIRMIYQCHICHKRFNNGLILQQHIRTHAGQFMDNPMLHDQSPGFEGKELTPPGFLPSLMGMPHFSSFLPLMQSLKDSAVAKDGLPEFSTSKGTLNEEEKDSLQNTTSSESTHASEHFDNSDNDSSTPVVQRSPEPLDQSKLSGENDEKVDRDRENSFKSQEESHIRNNIMFPPFNLAARPPMPPLLTPFGLFAPPLGLNDGNQAASGPRKFPLMPSMGSFTAGQGNTTCKICFKTLSCTSALEIHYRTHTKDRPFICHVCDRRFTTRGNMRQHMVTHKGNDGQSEAPKPKTARSRNSSDSQNQKTPKFPMFHPLNPLSSESNNPANQNNTPVLQALPKVPFSSPHFPFPLYGHPFAGLPDSIASFLSQAGSRQPISKDASPAKPESYKSKRDRDGETLLPESKRSHSNSEEMSEGVSTLMSPSTSRDVSPSSPLPPTSLLLQHVRPVISPSSSYRSTASPENGPSDGATSVQLLPPTSLEHLSSHKPSSPQPLLVS